MLTIGVDASRGFLNQRTGVEEYSYQLLQALAKLDSGHRFIYYLNGQENRKVASGFSWPDLVVLKDIPRRRFWVHTRLGPKARRDKVDVLFIPAQAMPFLNPVPTVVTLHGLEYEYYPESYSLGRRLYLRLSTKFSLRHALQIIAVSQNTKEDLVKMYHADPEKISVVYHGYDSTYPITNGVSSFSSLNPLNFPYANFILAIGRLEKRKNLGSLIKAFNLIRKKGSWPGQLVLIGKPGFGYQEIKQRIKTSPYREQIIEKGYVSDEEKWHFLSKADVFVFPSLYEGFGLPLLEAFAAQTPVVAARAASIPEIGGNACLYFDPQDPQEMSRQIERVLTNQKLKEDLIAKGKVRIKSFSWEECARESLKVIESIVQV